MLKDLWCLSIFFVAYTTSQNSVVLGNDVYNPCPDVYMLFPCYCQVKGERIDQFTTIYCEQGTDEAIISSLAYLSKIRFSVDSLVVSKPVFTHLVSNVFGDIRFTRLDLDASRITNISHNALSTQAKYITHLRFRCLTTDLEVIKPMENLIYFSTLSAIKESCSTAGFKLYPRSFKGNLSRLVQVEVLTKLTIENGAFYGLDGLRRLTIHCMKASNCFHANISNIIDADNKLEKLTLRNLEHKVAHIPHRLLSLLPTGSQVDMKSSFITELSESVMSVAGNKKFKVDVTGNLFLCNCKMTLMALYKKVSSGRSFFTGQCEYEGPYPGGYWTRDMYMFKDFDDSHKFISKCINHLNL